MTGVSAGVRLYRARSAALRTLAGGVLVSGLVAVAAAVFVVVFGGVAGLAGGSRDFAVRWDLAVPGVGWPVVVVLGVTVVAAFFSGVRAWSGRAVARRVARDEWEVKQFKDFLGAAE